MTLKIAFQSDAPDLTFVAIKRPTYNIIIIIVSKYSIDVLFWEWITKE